MFRLGMFTLVHVEHEEKTRECILMSCYPALHFKKLVHVRMRAGEQACNPTSRQLGRSQRGEQRIFIIQRNTGENTRASSYTKRQAGRDRQAGRQRDRPETNRQCSSLVW